MQYFCSQCRHPLRTGIAVLALIVCASFAATSAPYGNGSSPLTTLHRFKGGGPSVTVTKVPGPLVQGADGFIYLIGYQWVPGFAYPTLFRMDLAGNLSAIVRLKDTPLSMIQGTDSNFYITCVDDGNDPGTLIKVTPTGIVSELHRFSGNRRFHMTDSEDGADPSGSLVQGNDGALYGVTRRGGVHGRGIVYKITTDGKFTKLFDFYGDEFTGVQEPDGPLVIGKDGTLYGRAHTRFGQSGDGVIFRLTPSGAVSVLRAFDEEEKQADCLIMARDGNLYGTVTRFHTYPADRVYPTTYGTHLFRLTTSGVYSRFRVNREQCQTFGEAGTARFFDAGLHIFQGPDLNFYGFSSQDVLFQITPNGEETRMYVFRHDLSSASFTGDLNVTVSIQTAPEGYGPSSLILAQDGFLYGATGGGGSATGGGTIFRLNYAPKPIKSLTNSSAVRPVTTPKPVRPAAQKRKSKSKKPS